MKIIDAMTDWRAGAAVAGLLVVTLPTAAGATPIGALGADAVAGDRPARVVEQVATRCWWRNGVRRCRWSGGGPRVYGYYSPGVYGYYSPRVYGYYGRYENDPPYGNPRPEAYRTGTAAWWRAMERWGRTGNPTR
jgi:hypothetical protein